jgi:hypothetical protein
MGCGRPHFESDFWPINCCSWVLLISSALQRNYSDSERSTFPENENAMHTPLESGISKLGGEADSRSASGAVSL